MDTRSYEYMIYIHYTFPKHIDKKKIQIQLPKDPQTNSEIIIPSPMEMGNMSQLRILSLLTKVPSQRVNQSLWLPLGKDQNPNLPVTLRL